MIYPSIDLLGGQVVQLRGGDPNDCALALDDVFGVAERLARHGELAIIDLDAALGRGDNLALVAKLAARFPCRVGGGIRDHDRADAVLRAGARKIIIGTRATEDFLRHYPRERLIVALDSKAGRVVTEGWTAATLETPLDRARRLEPFCSEFLYTLVDREGRMGGTDHQAIAAMVGATDNAVVAAGGIATLDEVLAIDRLGASCQLGMGIYTGVIDLGEAVCGLLDWDKAGGLLPVVAQDEAGQVLMVAWTDREGLLETLRSGEATYFSRSRRQRWRKGETSGHLQHVDAVRYDCDRDTLLWRVRQEGRACHMPERHSCFGEQDFNLRRLQTVLEGRLADADAGSYTRRLFEDPALLDAKILEEAGELVEAQTDRELVWEAADVVFFVLTKLVARGLGIDALERELYGRHGRRRAPKTEETT